MHQSALMFHVGRSGSRVVGKLLNQHPEIDWQGESLHRPKAEASRAGLEDPQSYTTFGHLEKRSDQRTSSWLGVEVKFYHLAQHGFTLDEFN